MLYVHMYVKYDFLLIWSNWNSKFTYIPWLPAIWQIINEKMISRKIFLHFTMQLRFFRHIAYFDRQSVVRKLQNFTATILLQKFRESNFLLKIFVENKICMAVDFSFFHTVIDGPVRT